MIVIGVENYTGNALTNPVPFADNDAGLFAKYLGKQLDHNPVLLDTSSKARQRGPKGEATLVNTEFELNRMLTQAQPGDTIYIFISSRGTAKPGADGYIGTSDMVSEKPESTAVPVAYLRRLISGTQEQSFRDRSKADRVILFADVSRGPQKQANDINLRLAELGSIHQPAVAGILATQPGQISLEEKTLTHDPDPPGYGYFGLYLVKFGTEGRNLLSELYGSLAAKLPPETKGKQKPLDFGTAQAKAAPLLRASLDWPDAIWQRKLAGYPLLVASRWWPLGLFAMQTPAALARLSTIENALSPDRPVQDPISVANELTDLEAKTPSAEWERVRDRALTMLANDAQIVIDRYGMQDLLPDDPSRLQDEDFARAAGEFKAALQIAPSTSGFLEFRMMLEIRQLLCEALSKPGEAMTALTAAHSDRFANVRIPEVHNALGIQYLKSDYGKAIDEFQDAKKASPSWMYPRHNLALAYIERGDFGAAEREYRAAISTAPLQPYLYYNLGLLLHRMNRRNEARGAYKKALDTYDAAIGELQTRAGEWRKQGLLRDADQAEARAKIFKQNRAEVLNAWGALLAATRDTEGARSKYKEALNWNDRLCPVRDNQAQLEQSIVERKDKSAVSPDAVKTLQANLDPRVCPDFEPSRLRLAGLELKSGALDKAYADYKLINNTAALRGLAAVDAARGQYESAAKFLNSAIEKQMQNAPYAFPALYVDLAEVSRQAGNADACKSAFDQAIKAAEGAAYTVSKRELRKRANRCEIIAGR